MADQDKQVEKEIGESFKNIGKLLGESLGQGMADSAGRVRGASDELSRELLESQKWYYQEKERLEAEMDAAQEEKYRREYQNRLARARTAEQAEIYRQNEELRLQKKANEAYLENLKEHYETVKALIVDNFSEIAERATDSLEEFEKAREKMADKMRDFGGLFDSQTVTLLNAGPDGSKIVFEDTLLDLSDEREQLEQYAALLARVQSMEEIPRGMFNAIRELSVEDAIRFQEELLKMDDESREAYIGDWEAIQALAGETAAQSYAEETREALESIEQALSEWYGTIPDGFLTEGELSAEAFGNGFIKKLKSMQELLRDSMLSVVTDRSLSETSGKELKAGGSKNIHYNISYVLNSAGETVAQQLRAAQSHAEIEKLRGV